MAAANSSAKKFFSVDARTVLALGRDSIKDHTTAVLELVKNSYDAGAKAVVVEIRSTGPVKDRLIRVADNGEGMNESDVDKKWLRIGYSAKRDAKKIGKRRRVGEKGVGRLSADRLGSVLTLRSQSRDKPAVGLHVKWDAFDAPGKDLATISIEKPEAFNFLVPRVVTDTDETEPINESEWSEPNSPSKAGTELLITSLRQTWSKDDIDSLRRELSILTPPFDNVEDFQIRLHANPPDGFSGIVSSSLAHKAELEAQFTCSRSGEVNCRIAARRSDGSMGKPREYNVPLEQFVHQKEMSSETPPKSFGGASVVLYYYPRVAKNLRGTGLSLTQLREFLDANAGVKVYRDNVRVMPYGDPNKAEGGDWLGLGDRKARNPAGAARRDFRLSPNQLVGAVFITRDGNQELTDTSGREGLIHGEAFFGLKGFIMGCIVRLETRYHEIFLEKQNSAPAKPNPRDTIKTFQTDLQALSKSLGTVKSSFPKRAERRIELVQDQIGEAFKKIGDLQRSIDELASQATVYRGLASLGIAMATFKHETDYALDAFAAATRAARNIARAKTPNIDLVLTELAKAIEAGDRISAWGHFAIGRIKTDKRTRRVIDVTKLLNDLIDELTQPFALSEIKIDRKLAEVEGRFFAMDIESVALNLLTNAYYFTALNKKRLVSMRMEKARRDGRPGIEIGVADSGPGVDPSMRDKIWEPLVSTKIDKKGKSFGTGLGLSIVDDVVTDLGGARFVDRDKALRGALFTVWLPLQ